MFTFYSVQSAVATRPSDHLYMNSVTVCVCQCVACTRELREAFFSCIRCQQVSVCMELYVKPVYFHQSVTFSFLFSI